MLFRGRGPPHAPTVVGGGAGRNFLRATSVVSEYLTGRDNVILLLLPRGDLLGYFSLLGWGEESPHGRFITFAVAIAIAVQGLERAAVEGAMK